MKRRTSGDEYRTVQVNARQAVANAREEVRSGSTRWERLCLSFVRSCWELGPAPYSSPTAYREWLRTPRQYKRHWSGDVDDIPFGAPVFSRRINAPEDDAGHVFITGGYDRKGRRIFRSNDIEVLGGISVVHIEDFREKWNHVILGHTLSLYEHKLILPPSPNERKRNR